jgi:hypothetical protein
MQTSPSQIMKLASNAKSHLVQKKRVLPINKLCQLENLNNILQNASEATNTTCPDLYDKMIKDQTQRLHNEYRENQTCRWKSAMRLTDEDED